MATKLGDYSVRAGSGAMKFWPLNPGTTVAQATPPAPIAPVNPNPVVQPPTFAIFDVVIRMSDEPVTESTIANPTLLAQVSGAATVNSMPLTKEADGTAHICFAVAPSSGTTFEGILRLSAKRNNPTATVEIDLKLKATTNTLADNLFVLFVVHQHHPPKAYEWAKLKVQEPGATGAAISGANVEAKVLRDNSQFKSVNRKAPSLTTTASGYVASGSRDVLGLPTDWPILFNASRAGYVARGHMVRLAKTPVHDNLAPFDAATSGPPPAGTTAPVPMIMMPMAQARLAGRKIMLDPGHGVVYDGPLNAAGKVVGRRVYEWFVASRLADRIAKILVDEHGVGSGDVLRTRTAGFGLIEPTQMTSETAPEDGEKKFEYDMVSKRMRVEKTAGGAPAATLKQLSDLLLTRHAGANNAAQPVAAADRDRLLRLNGQTLISVISRLNAKQAPANRVQPGSLHWDTATNDYVYTHFPIAGGAPTTVAVRADGIAPDQWFVIDDAMLRNLIDRSILWSLANETVDSDQAFTNGERNAMAGAHANDYMLAAMLREVNVRPPHAYLDHGTKGWSPNSRSTYFNGCGCDLYLTLHENAGGGVGGTSLISILTGADAPPAEQVRIGKVFVKYIDALDQGLRTGGISKEEQKNQAALLHSRNTMRDKYAYLELEFMDTADPADATKYQYHSMVQDAFIERVARQVVCATVETLLGRQADLDSIHLSTAPGAIW